MGRDARALVCIWVEEALDCEAEEPQGLNPTQVGQCRGECTVGQLGMRQ